MMLRRRVIASLAVWSLATSLWARPTLYIIGDSTVRNSTRGQVGWGDPLVPRFDPAKIDVCNRAIGGRSSRTFLTEGRWDAVMANLKPGDFVLMQFGHNDGGKLNDERCRASIKGIGESTEVIVRQTGGKPETVHTYGWYLTKYVRDAKSKGAFPVVVSPIPRNIWSGDKIGRSDKDYGLWAGQVAEQERVPFIDFNRILADRYEALGREKTARLFAGTDHTHTGPDGAEFNAAVMADAIRLIAGCHLAESLLPGDLWLPAVFSDHMVLQRGMPLPVWGTARPGAEVTVRLCGKTTSAKADETGRWRIDLPALTEGGPFTLEVRSGGMNRKVVDAMVGEVWICAGRPGTGATQSRGSIANMRVFSAANTCREFPQCELAGTWSQSGAVTGFEARVLEQIKLPLGIINLCREEGSMESWIRMETLETHPQFEGLLKDYDRRQISFRDNPESFLQYGLQRLEWKNGPIPRDPDPASNPRSPAVLNNGVAAPLAPFAVRGVIWQDSVSKAGANNAKILIEDWRKLWNLPEMRFFQVSPTSRGPATIPILDSEGRSVDSILTNS